MSRDTLDIAALFIIMVLVQVLVFNHVVLFHVAVPIIFIYFIIRVSMGIDTKVLLTLSFILGFIVDVFSDTLGVNTLSCTILAMLKRPIFYSYVQRDDNVKDIVPNISRLGIFDYSKYLLTMTGIYCVLSFTIEYFSFASVKDIIIATLSSTFLSFILMLGIDSLMISRREKRL
ncbi:MAG: rod shape-determining protein MreD [Prevotella sp.]|nr:rod shape-determining protein MreD [Bacteroides sp.]MCM1366414.1 rod shape-determining protein MreD [Prevotella sp.]